MEVASPGEAPPELFISHVFLFLRTASGNDRRVRRAERRDETRRDEKKKKKKKKETLHDAARRGPDKSSSEAYSRYLRRRTLLLGLIGRGAG
jgi:hypothetical protein